MDLAEDHFLVRVSGRQLPLTKRCLVRAMQRSPGSDAALQGTPDPFGQIDMAALHLFEDRDDAKVWCRLQHRDHLGVEEFGEGVGAAAGSCLLFV